MASPSGCSEAFSADAASCIRVSSSKSAAITSVTAGFPSVTVPVLSNTATFILCAVSSASPFLNKIPCCAPLPVPTIIAVGVARPSAQGHAITSTATNTVTAKDTLSPAISQPMQAIIAIIRTVGTNFAATTSASFAIGAFVPCASSTILIICARTVSFPTLVARNLIIPFLLIDAPVTLSPICFSTGILSPVSIDSSIVVCPSIIMPSTGIFSPGLTRIISPVLTSSIRTSCSPSSFKTVAVFGLRPISVFIA